MSKRTDKKGRSKGILAPFAAMEHYVQNSLAYRKLPSTARAAYLEVLACYDGGNNGKIALSARELGDRLGMNKATASRALEKLQLHGFVFVTRRSSFHRKLKLSAEYRLTAFKCDRTGELASKLFMRWKPETQNTVAWAQLCGCTSATEDKKRRRKQTEQLHPCNHEGPKRPVHGCTHAPHLESAIGSPVTSTASKAKAGAANYRAGVPTSPLHSRNPIAVNSPAHGPDSFTIVTGQPLKSLLEIELSIPDDFHSGLSWPSAFEANPLNAALARLGGSIKRAERPSSTTHKAA